MNTAGLLDRIKKIRPWKRAGERAPHKPFLVLYALGQFQNGVTQIVYAEHEEQLKKLFADFGPPRRPTMSNPFTRLVNDGLWQVSALEDIESNGTYSDKDLRDMRATGGFPPDVLRTLKSNPGAVREIAELLLENNFPDSLHNDLLAAAGIDFEFTTTGKKRMRDPNFRDVVLEAYGRTCMCHMWVSDQAGRPACRTGSGPYQMEAVQWSGLASKWHSHVRNASQTFRFWTLCPE